MDMNTMKKQGFDPVVAVQEALEKAHKVQPKLNAMVTFVDPSEQLEHLSQVDPKGKFFGVPIVLKDNVNTKGILTTASSRILGDYVPVYDAAIVEKLRAAGAVVIGKSSMDELGMGGTNLSAATGPVYCPYDLNCISGGSSGGSAVLVASGVVPFAIGTDTGDSVRKPASYNGIIGVKPTYGRISRYGIIPYASSLDHVGYFTRSVQDAAVALEVLSGRDDRDMTSSYLPVPNYSELIQSDLTGNKIAILKNVTDLMEKGGELETQFHVMVENLRKHGAIVEEVEMRTDLMKACLPVYFIIANCEATANHSNLDGIRFGVQKGDNSYQEIMTQSRTAGFTGLIRKRFVIGSYGLFQENIDRLYHKAQKVRRLIVDNMNEIYKNYDAIVAPASLNGAPSLQSSSDALSNEYLVAENYMCTGNFSGYPSMTVPFAMVKGMPVGVNVTCRAFEETTMFSIGQAIEDESGWYDRTVEVK